ncbi:MAG TPA: PqqD family protein [Devosia sp.]|nr:PqqD family protein [Devosia sp.]
MSTTQTYVVKSRDVVAEDFEGEFVVLDLGTGKYYSLAGGTALIWRGLTAGHSLDTLCAELPSEDVRRAQAVAAVEALVTHTLIVPASSPASGPAEIAVEFAATSGPYEIDVFDDLADLLVADPIHDVDPEAGWPHLPGKE